MTANMDKTSLDPKLIAALNNIVDNSQKLVFVTDLDGTAIAYHPDPTKVMMTREVHRSLQDLVSLGVTVIALTGRSGSEADRLIDIPEVVIIGCAGWELRHKGKSTVHPKLKDVALPITKLLGNVRQGFLAHLIQTPAILDEAAAHLKAKEGDVVYERKAITSQFPEGIACNINLNQIHPDHQGRYLEMVESLYHTHISPEIEKIYALKKDRRLHLNFYQAGISISPYGEEGKDQAIHHIVKSKSDPTRELLQDKIDGDFDGLIFAADADQDAKAFELIKKIRSQRLHTAGIVVSYDKTSHQRQAVESADYSVPGIIGYADLLLKLVELINERQIVYKDK